RHLVFPVRTAEKRTGSATLGRHSRAVCLLGVVIMSRSWLKKIRQFASRGGKRRSHRSPRRRLNLELLEDRTLLSITLDGVPDWVEQGPGPIVKAGSTIPAQNNPVSGAIESIAVNPGNPKIVYVGTVSGGIWKTLDATVNDPV